VPGEIAAGPASAVDVTLGRFEEASSAPAAGSAPRVTLPASKRIADYAVSASSALSDKVVVEGLKRRYGSTTVSNVSGFEVKELELQVYYFADNYPDEDDNYRAIPRLKFFKGQPGDADGKVGTLCPVK
jgi:hypothetical protein